MILLVSGGLDSYITWHYLDKPRVLFVDYGQPYIHIEQEAINKLYNNYEFIKLEGIPRLRTNKIFVPARNLMLATLAMRYSNDIALGGVKDEKCKDKSPKAFKIMSTVLTSFNDKETQIFSPVWHLTKAECVKYYIDNHNPENLKNTVSCYSTEICNNCESCFRRFVALAHNGIIETNRLPKDQIIKQFIKKINIQPHNRAWEIISSLTKTGYNIQHTANKITYQDTSTIIKDQNLVQQLQTLQPSP